MMSTSPVTAGTSTQQLPTDKVSSVSSAAPAAPTGTAARASAPRTPAASGGRRAIHSSGSRGTSGNGSSDAGVFDLASSTSNSSNSPLSSIKSFRRKKYVRQRLSPLDGEQNQLQPADALSATAAAVLLTECATGSADSSNANSSNGRQDDNEATDSDTAVIERLKRVHAALHSDDAVRRWIRTYESERQRFASFAVFTEMKLDEIQGAAMGRPNAVEVAACFASLLKMPGIVGCYASLLEKLAAGLQSAIYLPDDDDNSGAAAGGVGGASKQQANDAAASPMAALVHTCFERSTYFAQVHELRAQLLASRSLRDPRVLRSLSVDELVRVLVQAPQQQLQCALAELASARASSERFDALLLFMTEHHAERTRQLAVPRAIHDAEDNAYPFFVPLATSAQICRAIAHSASSFSASGREMILCSVLEFLDVESFRDVFKRFDAHGKALFLHHLSLLESSEHLQAIVSQLPSAGEMLFRFYAVLCGAQGDPTSATKQVLFRKLLSAEMEYFFLCDLASYLNEEHFLLLSKEFEKHMLERKRRRRATHCKSSRSTGNYLDGDLSGDDDDDSDDSDTDRRGARSIESSIESFQLMIWNFLHHHRLASAQVLSIVTTVMLPSLDAKELAALLDLTFEQFPLDARWAQLLRFVDEIDAEHGAAAVVTAARWPSSSDNNIVDNTSENVRVTRLKLLKKLFSMLSRGERESWLDKINAKYMTEAMKKRIQSLKNETPKNVVIAAAPLPPAAPNLDDPKALVPSMKIELKIEWMECLLEAITTDKEYSARMAMLQQVLQPFLDGRVPGGGLPTKVSLAAVEKSITQMLNQLTPVEKLKVFAKIAPAPVPEDKPTLDRSTSPIPELCEDLAPAPPPALPTSNADILSAFQTLLVCRPEAHVVQILRNGLLEDVEDSNTKAATVAATTAAATTAAATAAAATAAAAVIPTALEKQHSALSSELKRKLSAVIAVAEPMEWHACVKPGCVDVACQTELALEVPPPPLAPLAPIELLPAAATATDVMALPRSSVLPTKLTLTALLTKPNGGTNSPRKKESKSQRLNSTAVPRAIGGLVTSWRVNAEQLAQFAKKPLAAVLKTIADAYGELLTAGRRTRQVPPLLHASPPPPPLRASPRERTLAQVVYQQFLHSYGLPGIADTHLLAFACAIETYRPLHLRVEAFARFCFDEVPRAELGNYLEFLECIVCDDVNLVSVGGGGGASASGASSLQSTAQTQAPPSQSKRGRFVPRVVVPDRETWNIGVDKAQEAAHLCFRAMRKPSVLAFCDRLVAIAAMGTSSAAVGGGSSASPSSTDPVSQPQLPPLAPPPLVSGSVADLTINVDHLLQLVALEWRDEQRRRDAFLLDAFRAGDVNGDGQLTSAEFARIVLSIDRARDAGDVLLMFSDTLRRTPGCEQIHADVFLQVAKEYELDRAVWSGDGELRHSVGDVRDLEATWTQHSRWFFLGTLEALARDLAPRHFLRVCEGAGCGCLKCILDSYIGFQRMRRDFALARQQQLSGPSGPGGCSDSSRGSHAGSHALGPVSESLVWARYWHLMRQLYEAAAESDGICTPWDGAACVRVDPAPAMAPRFVAHRRLAVPNLLFPDTSRVSARPRAVHDPEAFDAATINAQFADLLARMTFKKPEGVDGGTGASAGAVGDSAA